MIQGGDFTNHDGKGGNSHEKALLISNSQRHWWQIEYVIFEEQGEL